MVAHRILQSSQNVQVREEQIRMWNRRLECWWNMMVSIFSIRNNDVNLSSRCWSNTMSKHQKDYSEILIQWWCRLRKRSMWVSESLQRIYFHLRLTPTKIFCRRLKMSKRTKMRPRSQTRNKWPFTGLTLPLHSVERKQVRMFICLPLFLGLMRQHPTRRGAWPPNCSAKPTPFIHGRSTVLWICSWRRWEWR